jgi:formylglycine-generating enzyme required for sulfatase activity
MLAVATGKFLAGIAVLAAIAASHDAAEKEALPSVNEAVILTLDNGQKLSVARYEVTEAEWRQCYEEGRCSFLPKAAKTPRKQNFPITGVNRFDVAEFIAWINSRSKRTYRLPAAAEWDKLAPDVPRVLTKKLFDDPRLAWAEDFGSMPEISPRVQPSGHFGTEKNGVSDLKGNVSEWTSTCVRPGFTDADCPAYKVEGLHETVLSVFIRDPASGGCAVGTPPANIGFRLVRDVEDAGS